MKSEPRDSKGRTLAEFLAAYEPGDWPRPSLTVDTLLVTADREVLLIRRKNHPDIGKWALPGGFVGPDETVNAAAARELKEETGADCPVRQLVVLSDPRRDPRTRVVSVVCACALDRRLPVKAGDDAAEAKWFSVRLLQEGDRVTLTLDGPETLSASVVVKRDGLGRIDPDRCACEGDLAFDHAAAIAYAAESELWPAEKEEA